MDNNAEGDYSEEQASKLRVAPELCLDADDEEEGESNKGGLVSSVDSMDDLKLALEHVRATSEEDLRWGQFELLSLPPEVLLQVFNFVDSPTLLLSVCLVCKYFLCLVRDDVMWRLRMAERWPSTTPTHNTVLDVKKVCVGREREHRRWSGSRPAMQHHRVKDAHYASVDALHIQASNRVMITGGRDRALWVLDVGKVRDAGDRVEVESKDIQQKHILNAHKGWIWSINSQENHIFSGGWDRMIKEWDLSANMQPVSEYKCNSAVLCISTSENLAAAGTYTKTVYCFDKRVGATPVAEFSHHIGPVLCTCITPSLDVISCSEDRNLIVHDMRAKEPSYKRTLQRHAVSLSHGLGQLWIGNTSGQLLLLDTMSYKIIKVMKVFSGKSLVNGVCHNYGCVVACGSQDKKLVVLDNAQPYQAISAPLEQEAVISSMDYQDSLLACGLANGTINMWTPQR